MDQLLHVLLWVHAGSGFVCLLAGIAALASRKAAGNHPRAGRIFTGALISAYVAILLGIILERNVFMLGIGALAVYAGVDGRRSLQRFKGELPGTATGFDQALNGACALFSVGLGAYGAWVVATTGNMLGAVCIAFAILGGVLVRGSRSRLGGQTSRNGWLAAHIGLMSGAFSAAVTAFFAVQFSGRIGGLEWILWVAPTVVMMVWSGRQTKRMGLVEEA